MPSPDERLSEVDRLRLTEIAWSSIRGGLGGDGPLVVTASEFGSPLREIRCSFVSLHLGGELRGCIGGLEPRRPLVEDVARSAYRAAFEDPRFPALEPREFPHVELRISVLSPLEAMAFCSREDLIAQLRPKRDGLVLQQGPRRATFLPAVWESLPLAEDFLRELEAKGRFPPNAWSQPLECYRYTTEEWRG